MEPLPLQLLQILHRRAHWRRHSEAGAGGSVFEGEEQEKAKSLFCNLTNSAIQAFVSL